jgi:hypothetical protein
MNTAAFLNIGALRTRVSPFAEYPFSRSMKRSLFLLAALCLGATGALLSNSTANAQPAESPGITALHSNFFFKVAPAKMPKYAGANACSECHKKTHKTEIDTPHAKAFQTLKRIHQDTNPSCLPCHTVGYGLPTGFVSEAATPQLAGVQCESCHGPSARHMANEFNPGTRPLVDAGATMCGGCHTGSPQPTFEEWSSSEHAEVVEDMNPSSRISACGRCHSGSVRVSLLRKRSLPAHKANVPLGCPVCHDPHAEHVWTNVLTGVLYTNQLRNPVSSTNNYSLATTDTFSKKYNPNINLCGQCHNRRGATWQSTSRAPHHSPQYNVLLGNFDNPDTKQPHYEPSSHALLIPNQCAGCHMQATPETGQTPATTGHTFTVTSFDACRQCHSSPDVILNIVQDAFSNEIQVLKAGLDQWAASKAPAALREKYGSRAWEYTTPGDLSPGGSGPTTEEQKLIPNTIKKARFNLYIVLYDGSFGVHNADYSGALLRDAEAWLQQAMQ